MTKRSIIQERHRKEKNNGVHQSKKDIFEVAVWAGDMRAGTTIEKKQKFGLSVCVCTHM